MKALLSTSKKWLLNKSINFHFTAKNRAKSNKGVENVLCMKKHNEIYTWWLCS